MATNGTAKQPLFQTPQGHPALLQSVDWMRPTVSVRSSPLACCSISAGRTCPIFLPRCSCPADYSFSSTLLSGTPAMPMWKRNGKPSCAILTAPLPVREDYDHAVLRQPASLLTDGWIADGDARYFRRTKGGNVISDRFVRSHLFFTRDALLVCAREVSITEMDADTGAGYTDRTMRIPFADIRSAGLTRSASA